MAETLKPRIIKKARRIELDESQSQSVEPVPENPKIIKKARRVELDQSESQEVEVIAPGSNGAADSDKEERYETAEDEKEMNDETTDVNDNTKQPDTEPEKPVEPEAPAPKKKPKRKEERKKKEEKKRRKLSKKMKFTTEHKGKRRKDATFREIIRLQKKARTMIPGASFKRLIREIAEKEMKNINELTQIRIQRTAFEIIQVAAGKKNKESLFFTDPFTRAIPKQHIQASHQTLVLQEQKDHRPGDFCP
jgi:histone H3/H4